MKVDWRIQYLNHWLENNMNITYETATSSLIGLQMHPYSYIECTEFRKKAFHGVGPLVGGCKQPRKQQSYMWWPQLAVELVSRWKLAARWQTGNGVVGRADTHWFASLQKILLPILSSFVWLHFWQNYAIRVCWIRAFEAECACSEDRLLT